MIDARRLSASADGRRGRLHRGHRGRNLDHSDVDRHNAPISHPARELAIAFAWQVARSEVDAQAAMQLDPR